MNEPRRLSQSGGAAQRLLDSASLDRAGAASRQRVAALVSTSSAFSRSAADAKPRGMLRTFTTWAAIGAAASVAIGFAVSRLSPSSESSARPVVAAPLEPSSVTEIRPEPPRPVEPWASASSGTRKTGENDDFERARAAIARGDYLGALVALDSHEAAHRSGGLGSPEAVLRVQALQGAGRHEDARALARAILAQAPQHALRSRLESVLTPR